MNEQRQLTNFKHQTTHTKKRWIDISLLEVLSIGDRLRQIHLSHATFIRFVTLFEHFFQTHL